MTRYRLKSDSAINPAAKAGTIVIPYDGPDYGLADDDTRAKGSKRITVTLKDGSYPFFTHPADDLEEIGQ
jgi:hypothetical protein